MLPQGGFDVVVPEAVIDEIRAHGLADPTVVAIGRASWLATVPAIPIPPEVAAWELGAGESAVLALAMAESGAIVVIDDRDGRRCARSLNIPLIGTLGLVLRARRRVSSRRLGLWSSAFASPACSSRIRSSKSRWPSWGSETKWRP